MTVAGINYVYYVYCVALHDIRDPTFLALGLRTTVVTILGVTTPGFFSNQILDSWRRSRFLRIKR